MKRKTLMILILVLAIVGACATAVIVNREQLAKYFFDYESEIKQGFSDALLDGLHTQYGIEIPKEAAFIKGINTYTFRDQFAVILFTCSIDENAYMTDPDAYVCDLLNLERERYSVAGSDDFKAVDWYEDYGGQLDRQLSAPDDIFTSISYRADNNQLLIRFAGYRPETVFP